jgi:nitroreductase
MTAMELLLGRASAIRITEPAPTDAAIEAMIASALRAPDHGRLRPWRFILIRPDMREGFGDLLAEHLLRRVPDASAELLRRERDKAMRAPMILVVVQRSRPSEKIPQIEQLLSAGAAAQNILLAAHALGYGAVWKTGGAAYDDEVKEALGLVQEDAIVGFIYLGTHAMAPPASIERPVVSEFLDEWEPGLSARRQASAAG